MTQNYLTARQLGITQAELDALIWVRDALDPTISDHTLPAWMVFDMSTWQGMSGVGRPLCGTACCIGGSMELHMAGLTSLPGDHLLTEDEHYAARMTLSNQPERPGSYGSVALDPLFFSYNRELTRSRTGAVEAIDRFLAGNTANPWLVPGLDEDD